MQKTKIRPRDGADEQDAARDENAVAARKFRDRGRATHCARAVDHRSLRLPEQLEPGDREVAVESECVRHLVSTHDLEAHGVNQGEVLV